MESTISDAFFLMFMALRKDARMPVTTTVGASALGVEGAVSCASTCCVKAGAAKAAPMTQLMVFSFTSSPHYFCDNVIAVSFEKGTLTKHVNNISSPQAESTDLSDGSRQRHTETLTNHVQMMESHEPSPRRVL
jgi:hypothetical protein